MNRVEWFWSRRLFLVNWEVNLTEKQERIYQMAKYTRRSLNVLQVQFNNGFRMLLRLTQFCSASGMFAEKHVDRFQTIYCKVVLVP